MLAAILIGGYILLPVEYIFYQSKPFALLRTENQQTKYFFRLPETCDDRKSHPIVRYNPDKRKLPV